MPSSEGLRPKELEELCGNVVVKAQPLPTEHSSEEEEGVLCPTATVESNHNCPHFSPAGIFFFFSPRLFSYFEGGSKFLMEIQMFHKGILLSHLRSFSENNTCPGLRLMDKICLRMRSSPGTGWSQSKGKPQVNARLGKEN